MEEYGFWLLQNLAVIYWYDSKLNAKFMIKIGYLQVIGKC